MKREWEKQIGDDAVAVSMTPTERKVYDMTEETVFILLKSCVEQLGMSAADAVTTLTNAMVRTLAMAMTAKFHEGVEMPAEFPQEMHGFFRDIVTGNVDAVLAASAGSTIEDHFNEKADLY